eukprot:14851054-Alexandrium_andersonii.AAC.1
MQQPAAQAATVAVPPRSVVDGAAQTNGSWSVATQTPKLAAPPAGAPCPQAGGAFGVRAGRP